MDRSARRFRPALAVGLLASVLVHVGLFLAAGRTDAPLSAGTEGSSREISPDPRRSAPDDVLRAVSVREVRAAEIRVPARPRAVAAEPAAVEAAASATDPFSGAELREPGGGSGDAAGGDAGEGSGAPVAMPPVPRSVMPEWDAPASVRGVTVTLRVHVDSAGRPTGPVELEPRTPDEGFNRRLAATVREMRFSPARTARGRPVAAWAELTFSF